VSYRLKIGLGNLENLPKDPSCGNRMEITGKSSSRPRDGMKDR
jgi:hypothetical protein